MALMNIIIPSISALLGVLIGGWISSGNQRLERHHNRIREQVDNFYSPLLGKRAQILAKSELRLKVSGATGAAWRQLMGRFDDAPLKVTKQVHEERWPDFEKVVEENNRRFIEEVMPLYKEMVDHFAANMGLAEPSTRDHFGALVEFVEIWERWLDETIPGEAVKLLGHSEDNLKSLYENLASELECKSQELKDGSIFLDFKTFFSNLLRPLLQKIPKIKGHKTKSEED